jgi:hypothetical protein
VDHGDEARKAGRPLLPPKWGKFQFQKTTAQANRDACSRFDFMSCSEWDDHPSNMLAQLQVTTNAYVAPLAR